MKDQIRYVLVFVSLLFITVIGGIALAQPVVPDPNVDLGAFLKFLVEAFQGGNWWVAGGACVMLAVYGVGKFLKPGNSWLPVISAGLGMLAGLVAGFALPDQPWYESLYKGLLSGGAATIFWSTFGKKIFKKSTT